MGMHLVGGLVGAIGAVRSADELGRALSDVSAALGFQFYALTHHVDIRRVPTAAIRVHNYPDSWADYYDRNALGVSDPVHRAAHVSSAGFAWSRMADMIPLTPTDRRVLALGKEQGIGDGYTVPANVPGEARGSCSFANEAGRAMSEEMLPLAQWAGLVAFESARRLWSTRPVPGGTGSGLTDRQRECVMWVGRGKSDWETGRILGVSEETVTRHIKHASERYGVTKRTSLTVQALYDGTLTFEDVVKR